MQGATAYDPWAAGVIADPYPFYEDLRARGGCIPIAGRDMWVVPRYDDVVGVLRDPVTFTSSAGVSRQPAPKPSGWIGEDPPTHTETRRLAQPVLSRAGLAHHETTLEDGVDALVSEWVHAGGGDVVPLANQIATAAVCRIIGLPEALDDMVAMSEEVFRDISAVDLPTRDGPTEAQFAVGFPASEFIEGARHSGEVPADTIVATVIEHAGERIGLSELDGLGRVAYAMTLIGPGIETTRTMLSHAIGLAARHPDQWSLVVDGTVPPDAYVNEVLRFEAPIQGFFRGTSRAADLAGTALPVGARLLCLFGSANRDERQFDRPDVFDPGRDDAGGHLSFGFGIHRCVGAWLALAEGIAAVQSLARRVAEFEIVESVRQPDVALLRSWQRLEVSVTSR
ncbi:MAG: cytochrome P450 [Microthrixaceae bacterium]